jgi:hypothetical protein
MLGVTSDYVSAAGAARLIGATFIFVVVVFILFWPMWHSGELQVRLGIACGDMIAQIRQQPTGVGFTQAVAYAECWPTQAAR